MRALIAAGRPAIGTHLYHAESVFQRGYEPDDYRLAPGLAVAAVAEGGMRSGSQIYATPYR